jgi:DNA-binding CsgD family transcriptional regulator
VVINDANIIPSDEIYMNAAIKLANLLQSNLLTNDDICQIIAIELIPGIDIKGVAFFESNKDSSLTLTAVYGYSEEGKNKIHVRRSDGAYPLMLAITRNKVIFIEDLKQMFADYPGTQQQSHLDIRVPIIIVPLHKLGITIGAISIEGGNLTNTSQTVKFLELLGAMIVPKLNAVNVSKVQFSEGSKEVIRGLSLTKREHLIQARMADGKTNKQIAKELGFSESTIRQDAVNLFAKLGVNNREDAGVLFVDAQDVKNQSGVNNFFPVI